MLNLSGDKDAEVIEAFDSTSRYLDDLLNTDNTYFDGMFNQIDPSELQLNKANSSETEAPFLDLHLTISDGFVFLFFCFCFFLFCFFCFSKIYDKCDDSDFDLVNFPF